MQKTILTKQDGQMTVLLGVILLIITSLLAFIINIGVFVKAKINLQNAVDAAAYSGAAAQARYLTNISYMNWHMRNVYKEWLYKYYVLGQLGLADTRNDSTAGSMDFRLPPLANVTGGGGPLGTRATYQAGDPYNVPSVCITFANTFNICSTYTLPGLPRYESLGLPGIDETHNTFIRNLVEQKAKDCSARSNINFLVARQWTYGLKGENAYIPPNAPRIALDRGGAFPKALEAGIRVRNLERIINEPPKAQITLNTGNSLCQTLGSCESVEQLSADSSSLGAPIHERTVKAFWAGYRNLAKAPDGEANNLKDTFTLTELSPNPKQASGSFDVSLSYYLMNNKSIGQYNAAEKHYLDLQLNLLNLSIFYTLFTTIDTQDNVATIDQAACSSTKVALPVPGYPMGFTKNPSYMTYYAVKGEANFTGLFSPFEIPIKMVAYAAAKPYGGRIGPRLFNIDSDEQTLVPRVKHSYSYLSGLALNAQEFQAGIPIPFDQDFWIQAGNANVVGGIPASTGSSIRYAIPNMIHDFYPEGLHGFAEGNERLEIVTQQPDHSVGATLSQRAGLFTRAQFIGFKGPLLGQTNIGGQQITQGIGHSLKPTKYEAANYLIPTLERHNESQAPRIAGVGFIPKKPNTSTGTIGDPDNFRIYAPLFGSGMLYQSPNDLQASIQDYIDRNGQAIDTYLESLQKVAKSIREPGLAGGEDQYAKAAGTIFAPMGQGTSTADYPTRSDNSCDSIAGNFTLFFFGGGDSSNPKCPKWLKTSITESWSQKTANDENFAHFQESEYVVPAGVGLQDGEGITSYMTAYLPGPNHGATNTGIENFPLPTNEEPLHRRNFYSVKFIPLESLINGSTTSYEQENFELLVESMRSDSFRGPDDVELNFNNTLQDSAEVSSIKH